MQPYTRKEKLYDNILGGNNSVEPFTREEIYLAEIAENSGGMILFEDVEFEINTRNGMFISDVTEHIPTPPNGYDIISIQLERTTKLNLVAIFSTDSLGSWYMRAIADNDEGNTISVRVLYAKTVEL